MEDNISAQVSHTATTNIAPSDSEWPKQQNQSNAPESSAILPDELIPEVLSYLDVKSLLKLRCVCKSWKSLISNPKFVQLHLKRSERNPHLALHTRECDDEGFECNNVVPFPIRCLLENPFNTLPNDPDYRLDDKECLSMVDSCNGLICLSNTDTHEDDYENWFRFWNPATKEVSEKLGHFRNNDYFGVCFHYMFGYDRSSCTYKLVTLHLLNAFAFEVTKPLPGTPPRTDVKVFSFGGNGWRLIHSLRLVPVLPLYQKDGSYGADFRGSLNWMALRTDISSDPGNVWKNVIVEQFVISSLDLATETCTQLMPPPSFDELPHIYPHICVLVDCLCFSHDVKGTHLVIWKMTEFGIQESWTQFLKISYQSLAIDYYSSNLEIIQYRCWTPLHISGNGDTVILSRTGEDAAYIYNLRDNTVKKTRTNQKTMWFYSRNYVESLVSPC